MQEGNNIELTEKHQKDVDKELKEEEFNKLFNLKNKPIEK